jgi:hypothetical protein
MPLEDLTRSQSYSVMSAMSLATMTYEFFGGIVLVTCGVIETEVDAWGVEVETVVFLGLEILVFLGDS